MKKRKKQNPYPAPTPGKVNKRSAGLSAVSAKDGEGEGGVRFTPPLASNVRTSAVNEISQKCILYSGNVLNRTLFLLKAKFR